MITDSCALVFPSCLSLLLSVWAHGCQCAGEALIFTFLFTLTRFRSFSALPSLDCFLAPSQLNTLPSPFSCTPTLQSQPLHIPSLPLIGPQAHIEHYTPGLESFHTVTQLAFFFFHACFPRCTTWCKSSAMMPRREIYAHTSSFWLIYCPVGLKCSLWKCHTGVKHLPILTFIRWNETWA